MARTDMSYKKLQLPTVHVIIKSFSNKKRLLYVPFKLFVSLPSQLWQIHLWMEVIDLENQIPWWKDNP